MGKEEEEKKNKNSKNKMKQQRVTITFFGFFFFFSLFDSLIAVFASSSSSHPAQPPFYMRVPLYVPKYPYWFLLSFIFLVLATAIPFFIISLLSISLCCLPLSILRITISFHSLCLTTVVLIHLKK